MTNNEAVRCPECGRRTAWAHREFGLIDVCAKNLGWSDPNKHGAAIQDCAAHAKAKAVPDAGTISDTVLEGWANLSGINKATWNNPSASELRAFTQRVLAWNAALQHLAESSKAVPAEGQRVEEPVAWMHVSSTPNNPVVTHDKPTKAAPEEKCWLPLYTRPASIAEGFVAVPRASVAFAAGALDGMGKRSPNEEAQQHADALLAALSADSGSEK